MSAVSNERPALLLAGGRLLNTKIIKQHIAPAFANSKKPTVAYVGAASGDSTPFYLMLSPMMHAAGASKVDFVKLAREDADVEAAKKSLSAADVVFLSGGEVEDGIKWIRRHGLADFFKDLYYSGKQFVGASAGTIMMGAYWVKWDVPGDDATAQLFECLNIIPATFDTHAEDEDWIELKTALRLMGEGSVGYGLTSGNIIKADSRGGDGGFENIDGQYLTFEYTGGRYNIRE